MLSGGGKTTFVSGPAGPPNSLSIRNVTTGAPGSPAAAQINGTAPAQTLDLTIPKGQPGATGPSPWAPPIPWTTGLVCVASAPATTVVVSGQTYVCALSHLAGTFATDLAAGRWQLVAAQGLQPWKTAPIPWASGIAYTATAPADCVTYGGGCYVCTTSHTSGSAFDGSQWAQIAASGQAPGALLAANNLSEVASVGQSLANLKQTPLIASANTGLAVTDFDRPALLTGSPTLTVPNGGAGWHTGPIKNANTATGLVTLAVPSGATLDGVTNGTTVLFPYQRARILQTGATAYITDWIERAPILVDGTTIGLIAAGTPSTDLVLPAGYSRFRLSGSNVALATSGASFGVRFGDAGGVKAGASDYISQRTQSYGTTVQGRSLADTFGYILLAATDSGQATKGILDFLIWPGATGSDPEMLGQSYFYDGSPRNLFQSGIEYTGGTTGAMARATLLRLLSTSGNFTGGFTLVGEP